MPLSRDSILSASKPRTKTIEVPELGGEVIIRSMSGNELQELTDWPEDDKTIGAIRDVIFSVVDESGNRQFTIKDAPALSALDAAPFLRISNEVRKLNGFDDVNAKN